jgi:hypothetical protein
MAGLLTVQRHGDSMRGSPVLSSTSSLMRQPSAEDLDAAHQLVSSARGRPDVMHEFTEENAMGEGASIPSDRRGSQENESMVNGSGKPLMSGGNQPMQNGSQNTPTPSKGGAPSGQTCRFVSSLLDSLDAPHRGNIRTYLFVATAVQQEHLYGDARPQEPLSAMPVACISKPATLLDRRISSVLRHL